MKRSKLLTYLLGTIFLTFATNGLADTLAGVAFTNDKATVTCYLFNFGTGTVTISSKGVYQEGVIGVLPILPGSDDCGTSLAPNKVCGFSTAVTTSGANACKIVITPTSETVRGELEIRDSAGQVRTNIELR